MYWFHKFHIQGRSAIRAFWANAQRSAKKCPKCPEVQREKKSNFNRKLTKGLIKKMQNVLHKHTSNIAMNAALNTRKNLFEIFMEMMLSCLESENLEREDITKNVKRLL